MSGECDWLIPLLTKWRIVIRNSTEEFYFPCKQVSLWVNPVLHSVTLTQFLLSSVPQALDAMQHILLTNSGESGGGGQLSAASLHALWSSKACPHLLSLGCLVTAKWSWFSQQDDKLLVFCQKNDSITWSCFPSHSIQSRFLIYEIVAVIFAFVWWA